MTHDKWLIQYECHRCWLHLELIWCLSKSFSQRLWDPFGLKLFINLKKWWNKKNYLNFFFMKRDQWNGPKDIRTTNRTEMFWFGTDGRVSWTQTSADSTLRVSFLSGFSRKSFPVSVCYPDSVRNFVKNPVRCLFVRPDRDNTELSGLSLSLSADVSFDLDCPWWNQSITYPIVWSYLETSQAISRPCNKDFVDLVLWSA